MLRGAWAVTRFLVAGDSYPDLLSRWVEGASHIFIGSAAAKS